MQRAWNFRRMLADVDYADCASVPVETPVYAAVIGTVTTTLSQPGNHETVTREMYLHTLATPQFVAYCRSEYSEVYIDSEMCMVGKQAGGDKPGWDLEAHSGERWYSATTYRNNEDGSITIFLTFWGVSDEHMMKEIDSLPNTKVGWAVGNEDFKRMVDMQPRWTDFRYAGEPGQAGVAAIAKFFGLEKLRENSCVQCIHRLHLGYDSEMIYYTLVDHLVPWALRTKLADVDDRVVHSLDPRGMLDTLVGVGNQPFMLRKVSFNLRVPDFHGLRTKYDWMAYAPVQYNPATIMSGWNFPGYARHDWHTGEPRLARFDLHAPDVSHLFKCIIAPQIAQLFLKDEAYTDYTQFENAYIAGKIEQGKNSKSRTKKVKAHVLKDKKAEYVKKGNQQIQESRNAMKRVNHQMDKAKNYAKQGKGDLVAKVTAQMTEDKEMSDDARDAQEARDEWDSMMGEGEEEEDEEESESAEEAPKRVWDELTKGKPAPPKVELKPLPEFLEANVCEGKEITVINKMAVLKSCRRKFYSSTNTPEKTYPKMEAGDARRMLKSRASYAKESFVSNGQTYYVVSMPNGFCFDFVRLVGTDTWAQSDAATVQFGSFVEISQMPYLEELWLEKTSKDGENPCFHAHAVMTEKRYFAILGYGGWSTEGILDRKTLSEGRNDHWTYDRNAGFVKTFGANLSEELIMALGKAGVKYRILDASNNMKITAHGGHEDIRRVVDCMHARTWNDALESACKPEYDRWIDVGSKYAAVAKMLFNAQVMTPFFDCEINFIPFRPADTDYNREYHRNNESNYHESYLGKYVVIPVKNKWLKINFQAVRTKFLKEEASRKTDILTFVDSHYYNRGNPLLGLKIYSGLDFPKAAGVYRLKGDTAVLKIRQNEGSPSASVEMQTNTNTVSYEHDLVVCPGSKLVALDENEFFKFFYGASRELEFVKGFKVQAETKRVDWAFERLFQTTTDLSRPAAIRLAGFDALDVNAYKPTGCDYRMYAADNFELNDPTMKTVKEAARIAGVKYSGISLLAAISLEEKKKRNWILYAGAGITAATYLCQRVADYTTYCKLWSEMYACQLAVAAPISRVLNSVAPQVANMIEVANNFRVDEAAQGWTRALKYAATGKRPGNWEKFRRFVTWKKENTDGVTYCAKEANKQLRLAGAISASAVEDSNVALAEMNVAAGRLDEATKQFTTMKGVIVAGVACTLLCWVLWPKISAYTKKVLVAAGVMEDRNLSVSEERELLKARIGAYQPDCDLTQHKHVVHRDNLKMELVLDKFINNQPTAFIRTQNNRLKLQKPLKTLKVNKNLIELNVDFEKMYQDHTRQIRREMPQPPLASFEFVVDGKVSRPHCYDSKNIVNLLIALFDRQLGTLLMPHPHVVQDFEIFVRQDLRQVSWTYRKIEGYREWVEDHDGWDKKKKKLYIDNIRYQMGDKYDDKYFKNEYDGSVKNLEMYHSEEPMMAEDLIEGVSDRPRIIMVPNDSLKGVITWMQKIAFNVLKAAYPEFVHAENSQDMWARTWKNISYLEDPVAYSMDGGSHDSHQHASLIEAVDFNIWKLMEPLIDQHLRDHGAQNPDRLKKNIMRVLLSTKAKINIKNSHGRKYGTAVIDGTVFSGSPTLTTLGNTMRVIFYHKYAAAAAGLQEKDYVLRVAGDDALMWISGRFCNQYEGALQTLFAENKQNRTKGLGQVLEWSRNPWYRAEFCSKILVCKTADPTSAHWVRKPESILRKGQRYYGTQADLIESPEKYSNVWATGLLNETRGPIYLEIGLIRMAMSNGASAEEFKKKISAFKVKNDLALHLEQEYIREFSFWMGCSERQGRQFHRLLNEVLIAFDGRNMPFGVEIPHPREFD
jgi:hypothetical protein